ncbi:MAG: NIPSNAP family protein [Spirosomataceae bacterium]
MKTLLLSLGILCISISLVAKPSPYYYEMRIYKFANESQKKVVEDYWQQTAIPALNRLNIPAVGVFNEADQKEGIKLYVLIPYKSLSQFEKLPAQLQADATYQQAAKVYLDTDPASPAYDRYESSLGKAFQDWPVMKLPPLTGPKNTRVYEYRLYESHSETKGLSKIHMFNQGGEINIFVRLGFNPVFFAQTIIGAKQPNLTYMTTFDDKASRDAHWKAFSSDAEWTRLKTLPEYQKNMTKAEIHFLTPTDFSQI